MSGDMSSILPLPDASGIIPRALHSLFQKLENEEAENTVKCSFIELYNEELRDLLSHDESVKLKLFEDSSRKSHSATMVQGIEETHIDSAAKGLDLLRTGSHKRQVAATKCNDLSSRSHTVFTMTTYIKRKTDSGEDYICSGKLNLVDLAGSENIQRSGAENKRAAEAGLINKSLLTLGRVINALVDKNSHIPYRESKLTRLLQDSLGGRTKTCIIATLSPAKSNLEETISTLDYAFRAKNIRNKPQINPFVSKKTLLREFTAEIEKLKSELIATRQRNGVYLTTGTYEEMTTESESRRILSEEQRDKIETMEGNLRNKAQELFNLTQSLTTVKKDWDGTKVALQGTRNVLEHTEISLSATKSALEEEELLRRAHERTENQLVDIGQGLISTLGKATSDIGGLHAKSKRKSDVQSLNRAAWTSNKSQVADTTQLIEQRMRDFEAQHSAIVSQLSQRMQTFVEEELSKLRESDTFLDEKTTAFEIAEGEVNKQTSKSRDDMNVVLEGIKTLREDVKHKVGEGLDGLSTAAQRISGGVITELESFHTQLHSSFAELGKEFKTTFDDVLARMGEQQAEADELRKQLSDAGTALAQSNENASSRLDAVLAEEKKQGALDRSQLLSQITLLVQSQGETQDTRLASKVNSLRGEMKTSNQIYATKQETFGRAMDRWIEKEKILHEDAFKSREGVKARLKHDWTSANEQTSAIQETTRNVHGETLRIVDQQLTQLDNQLLSLDEIVNRVRAQNIQHHDTHVESLRSLESTVKESYVSLSERLTSSKERTNDFSHDFGSQAGQLKKDIEILHRGVGVPLAELRNDILASTLNEYVPTGQTPQKNANYPYSRSLPRTAHHEALIKRFRDPEAADQTLPEPPDTGEAMGVESRDELPDLQDESANRPASPTKGRIFTDPSRDAGGNQSGSGSAASSPVATKKSSNPSRPASAASTAGSGGLREIDVNAGESKTVPINLDKPPAAKKQNTGFGERDLSQSVGVGAKVNRKAMAEGRENQPLSASVGVEGGRSVGGRALRRRRS